MRRINLLLLAFCVCSSAGAIVKDEAKILGHAGRLQLERRLEDLRTQVRVDLNVTTHQGFPEAVRSEDDEVARGQALQGWASAQMKKLAPREIRILINVAPELVVLGIGEELAATDLGKDRRAQLTEIISSHSAHRAFAEGVTTVIKFVSLILTGHSAKWEVDVPPTTTLSKDRTLVRAEIMPWILWGLVLLLVIGNVGLIYYRRRLDPSR